MSTYCGFSKKMMVHLPLAGRFISLIFLFSRSSNSVPFSVVGPDHPIITTVGEDAVLPCQLSPGITAQNMEVNWFRRKSHSVVFVYHKGQEIHERQATEYRGRTEFIANDIAKGMVALRITNTRVSDEGEYTCFFQSESFYDEAFLEVKVTGFLNGPFIRINEYQGSGIKFVCQSTGWYPEPEVLWEDADGNHVSSSLEVKTQDEDGLFNIEMSLILMQSTNKNISCIIRNTFIKQVKEVTISVSDTIFPRVSLWMPGFLVMLAMFICFILLVFWHFWKQKKQRGQLERKLETLNKDIGILSAELEWRRTRSYAVDITLNPDTAHPDLIVTSDQKRVQRGATAQNHSSNSERFDTKCSVLGCKGFRSGRHYWEVEISGEGGWAVGAARQSVVRKGPISHSPEDGIWAIGIWWNRFRAGTVPETFLSSTEIPQKVRVYLDYDQGHLIFYNAGTMDEIFKFTDSFTEKMYPYFWIGYGTELIL